MDGKVELARWTTSPQVITEAGDLLLTCKGTIGGMAFNDFGNAHITILIAFNELVKMAFLQGIGLAEGRHI